MAVLLVSLFGGIRIAHDAWQTELKLPHAAQVLLAYLVLERHRTHSREVLANLIWEDKDDGHVRGSFNTVLWRLRSILEPIGIPRGTYLVTTPTGAIGFNCDSNHWVDLIIFEGQVKRVLDLPVQLATEADVHALQESIELYRGELLEGFYDDWALRERERLRRLHLNSMAYLMRYYEHQGAYEKSLAYGARILAEDPLREEIHRNIMHLCLANGQRTLAVRQYEICRAILKSELGIAPMEETQKLYGQIISGNNSGPVATTFPARNSNAQEALELLHSVQYRLAGLQEELRRATELLNSF
jgi:DNA-binding SARP family transcriptional activator